LRRPELRAATGLGGNHSKSVELQQFLNRRHYEWLAVMTEASKKH
jgi:hypothetical protein